MILPLLFLPDLFFEKNLNFFKKFLYLNKNRLFLNLSVLVIGLCCIIKINKIFYKKFKTVKSVALSIANFFNSFFVVLRTAYLWV